MNVRVIMNFNGLVLLYLSSFMILPILVSIINGSKDLMPLIYSFLITLLVGITLFASTTKNKKEDIKNREAFLIVTLAWMMMSLFGSLPFLFSGTLSSFTDAYFESMAGFTTTGASVIKNVEIIPEGVLFWRSLTQWIGGMGIIVFALAILPFLGTGGMQLFRAEVPEINVDKLRPRIIDTAKALWIIYLFLTIINALLLHLSGMNIFDAICHAFTTMATGGFSTKNASLAAFGNPGIEYITSLFMFLAGVNYTLYFYFFKGQYSILWKSSEFKFYLSVTLIATILVTFAIFGSSYGQFHESLRYALFQVTSVMTTTGYATADYEKWHPLSHVLLMLLMFFGGMIGSTGGGLKQVRMLLALKQGYRELYQLIHPRAITSVKLDNKFLDKEILGSIWGMIFLFLSVCALAIVGVSATGIDIITSTSTVISAMCNVGPALGMAGPAENYAEITPIGKWILTFCMLTGRLEVYTVLILFMPQFWKK